MLFFRTFSKGLIFTLVSSFVGAVWIVITSYLLHHGENPINLTAWISSLAALAWLGLFKKHYRDFKKLSTKNIGLLVFIGIASSIGINLMQSFALANTSAINFSFLYRTVIVFTIFFAWFFFKEKITKKKSLLVLFILIGSYLVTTNGKHLAFTLGDMYTLLMAASAAFISNILIKHTISKMHTDLSGAVTVIVAGISLVSFANLTHVYHVPHNLPLVLIGSLFYFVHILLRNRAYKHASASFVSMVYALAPFYVTILSYFMLGETISLIELIGGLLIVGSIIFVERFKI